MTTPAPLMAELKKQCSKQCGRAFCYEHLCLYIPTNSETNRIIFEEHVKVLREFSASGQMVTDLYMLIKKHLKLKSDSEQTAEYCRKFDSLNPKMWTMSGVLITATKLERGGV